MTFKQHVWKCNNHGTVRHSNKEYKCKRLDCNLNYRGFVDFDYEKDHWVNFTDLSDDDVGLAQLLEPRSRVEYRSILENKTDNELIGIQHNLPHNVQHNCIGPIFHSEIIFAIGKRIKNVT